MQFRSMFISTDITTFFTINFPFCIAKIIIKGLDIPDHLKAPLRVLRKACIAESGVAEEHIINSKNGNLPNVPELKCYVLCLLEHSGMVSILFTTKANSECTRGMI